jgi:predicted alpha/beta hydrolase
MHEVERETGRVESLDGASAHLQLHVPAVQRCGLYWLPALGVGIGPNETLADALAARGIVVAVHEWRGLGGSNRRAARHCDWGYGELIEHDIPAGLAAARARHPQIEWLVGGHSLGGQLALIHAARARDVPDVFLVASGHPYWRAFGGWRALGVHAFAASIPLVTALTGHFPGTRLGFAGREAGRLMREWARTARRGDYDLPDLEIDAALARHRGRVLALRMAQDRLAPPGAIEHLRGLAPAADWTLATLGPDAFSRRRPDHFGWLREPAPVVEAFLAWRGRDAGTPGPSQDVAPTRAAP